MLKSELAPTLSENFTGIIWKVLLDNVAGFIAIESRNTELRQVSFSVLNYITGERLIKELTVDEPWYSALAHIGNGHLFINGYEYAGSPVSKGIIAIKINNVAMSWQQYNLSFYDAWNEGLRVYNPNISPRKFDMLEPETGKTIQVDNPTTISTDLKLPENGSETLIPSTVKHELIVGEISHLSYRNLTIISFHESIDGYLRLRLVVHQDNNILLDIIIADSIQKLQYETFFVQHNHLFCIQNTNRIVSYKLV